MWVDSVQRVAQVGVAAGEFQSRVLASGGRSAGPRLEVAAELCLGRVSPADAERVPGGVGVHRVALVGVEIACLQDHRSEPDGALMRCVAVVDVQVDVDLLWVPSGQSGGVWFGACWTPIRQWPSASITQWKASSSSMTLPSSMAAQNALSVATLAASNTTTWRMNRIVNDASDDSGSPSCTSRRVVRCGWRGPPGGTQGRAATVDS